MSEDGIGVEMVRLVLMLSDGEDERLCVEGELRLS